MKGRFEFFLFRFFSFLLITERDVESRKFFEAIVKLTQSLTVKPKAPEREGHK